MSSAIKAGVFGLPESVEPEYAGWLPTAGQIGVDSVAEELTSSGWQPSLPQTLDLKTVEHQPGMSAKPLLIESCKIIFFPYDHL